MSDLELFNECCVCMAGYHLYLFTDFMPDKELQYTLGFSIISIIGLNLVLNLGTMLIKQLSSCKYKCLKRRHTKAWKKYNKRIMKAALAREKYLVNKEKENAPNRLFMKDIMRV